MSTLSKIALPVAKAVKNLMWPRQHWLKALVIPTTDALITANLMALTPQGRKWLADSQQFMLDKGMLPFRDRAMNEAIIDDLRWPGNPVTKVPKEPNSWPSTVTVVASATKNNYSSGLGAESLITNLKHETSLSNVFKKLQTEGYDRYRLKVINSLPYMPPLATIVTAPDKKFFVSEATSPINWHTTTQPVKNRFLLGLSGHGEAPKLEFNLYTNKIASVLQQRYGVPLSNTFVTSSEPTLQQVFTQIDKTALKIKQLNTPSELVIVYSGHGFAKKTGKTEKESDYEQSWSFKPDSTNKSKGEFFEKDLKRKISAAFPKNTKITLIDLSCHSGAMLN